MAISLIEDNESGENCANKFDYLVGNPSGKTRLMLEEVMIGCCILCGSECLNVR